ncbi:MAG: TetR/AcrR family transcriptional regulator [Bacteroidales bacterium]
MNIRTRILEQASKMFFENGIRSITMDDISEALGMSKRTLYESFSNKEELLKECIEYQYEKNLQIRQQIEESHKEDPLEVINQHFRHMMAALNSIHPGFLQDIQKYHSSLWNEHVKSKQDQDIAYTRSVMERGIEKGLFRIEADTDILSKMIHSLMPLMLSSALFPETSYTRTEVYRQVLLTFIRGMATPEGLLKIDNKFQ